MSRVTVCILYRGVEHFESRTYSRNFIAVGYDLLISLDIINIIFKLVVYSENLSLARQACLT